jgi:ribonuclease BN (tRNA processing enzyme)
VTNLDLAFIGTGNAFAPGGLCWNGFLLNEKYLFEAPPQALMSLNRLGVDPNTLEAVVLSHHHGDHFLGLPFLLLHWKYYGRTTPIRIIGPAETEDVTRQVCERVYPGVFDVSFDIEWVTAVPGTPVVTGSLTVESVRVKHDKKLIENLGYACGIGGRRFAYTGDSALCDAVLDLARGAELLVSECASRAENIPVHMNLVDDIPLVRAALPPDSSLLLTHIGPGVTDPPLPRTAVARDFERYCF